MLRNLFRPEAVLFSAAASLTQPIFDGGTLLGQLELKKGLQEELLQTYRKAVISGFGDVDSALIAVEQTALAERADRPVVTSARKAFDISETRLREGTVDLVTVLQTQQTLFQAQDALAPGAASAPAGDRQPLSGARRRLAAAGSATLCDGRSGEPVGQYQTMKFSIPKIRKDRRNILIGLAGIFVLAIVGAIVTQSLLGSSTSPGGRRSRGGDDGPVPVLVAAASAADVPIYIDGVGTTRALNTVTVRSQVDGKLIKVGFKEGQDVDPRLCAGGDRPRDLSGAIRSGGGEEGARRSAARQCADRS